MTLPWVIPAKAGTQTGKAIRRAAASFVLDWAPAFAGVTGEKR